MAYIVLAPGSAGKSHFVKGSGRPIDLSSAQGEPPRVRGKQIAGITFVDGDDVIRDTIGWPSDPEWWKGDPAKVKEIERAIWESLVLTAAGMDDRVIILFNGKVEGDAVIARVRIPDQLLALNAERKAIEQQVTGRKRGQPSNPGVVLDAANRSDAFWDAHHRGKPQFSSFMKMVWHLAKHPPLKGARS